MYRWIILATQRFTIDKLNYNRNRIEEYFEQLALWSHCKTLRLMLQCHDTKDIFPLIKAIDRSLMGITHWLQKSVNSYRY